MEKATITRLEVENYKAIRAARVAPGEGGVIVGGRNAQGKSSLLDSIMAALAGKAAIAERPVRDGAEAAEVRLTLSNGLTVRRTIRPDGSGKLFVEDAEGRQLKAPQAVIDKLARDLTFDPLAFSRLSAKEQLATLQKIVGLDFTSLEAERSALYDERRDVNREAKRLEGAVESAPKHDDAPAEEVSVAALAEELRVGEDAQRTAERAEASADSRSSMATSRREEAEDLRRRAASLEAEADRLVGEARAAKEAANEARAKVPDLDALRARLAGAEDVNAKVRANRERAKREAELKAKRAESEALTGRIEDIDAAKQTAIAGAKFPLEGLSIGAEGLLYRGVPFSSASQAEKLRVSVAIGAALPSQLGIMLVREGALLDDEALVAFAEQAQAAGVQAWIEVVGNRDGVGIVIEDGYVVGAEEAEAAE